MFVSGIKISGKTLTVTINLDPHNLKGELKNVEEVARGLRESIDTIIAERKKVQEKVGISTETAVAIFFYNTFSTSEIDFEKVTGRPERTMYSIIAKLYSRLEPDSYKGIKNDKYSSIKDSKYSISYSLIEHEYITVGDNGDVLVNGKKASKLFESLGFIPTVAESMESEMLAKIVDATNGKILLKLASNGRLPEKVIRAALNRNVLTYTDILVQEVGKGMRLWNLIPDRMKHEVISKMPTYQLRKILLNEDFRTIFSDSIDAIIETVLEDLEPNLSTYVIYMYHPKAIGIPRNAKLFQSGDFIGIKTGSHIVQVITDKVPDPTSVKKFVVYREDKKIGMPIRARNIFEAVSVAIEKYDEYLSEIEKIKGLDKRVLSEKGIYYVERKPADGEEYRIPTLLYGGWSDARTITLGTYNKLRRELKSKKEKEEVVENAI